jgi:small subunit ribosomal protein S9
MYRATGRRKTAVAQVIMDIGDGKIVINEKPLNEYYQNTSFHRTIFEPLAVVDKLRSYDINVKVTGSGISSQAQAIRHGIARALVKVDGDLKPKLREHGLITRDDRKKERAKAGLRGARKDRQYRKR